MPRSKSAPKRKLNEEPSSLDEESLLAKVQAGVEEAEIDRWQRIIETEAECAFPAIEPIGLARIEVSADDVAVLRELHRTICEGVQPTGWGGVGDKSGRLRGYGYFAGVPISEEHFSAGQSILEYTGADAERDRDANRRASCLLSAACLPSALDATLERIASQLRSVLPKRFTPVLRVEQLVAAQPNLHNGRRFLKPHLDEPLHDGFGIVIVTVGIQGSASILLSDGPATRSPDESSASERRVRRDLHFRLGPGQAYALADDARNKCVHGVLADVDCAQRESLNLRFGLHRAGRSGHQPCVASDLVDESCSANPQDAVPSAPIPPVDDTEAGPSSFRAWDEVLCHWQ